MKNQISRRVAFAFVFGLTIWLAAMADAVEKSNQTVVTVSEMCGGCVTKITKEFEGTKSIAGLKCDIATKTVTFTPEKSQELSPLTLWERMDKIGKTPVKLVGPTGTYTSKPKK